MSLKYLYSLVIAVLTLAPLSGQVALAAASLADRMRGRILLQVESHGEAWYVHPDSGERYYMKDGAVAYEMMRSFGLGIKNVDLAKIAVGQETRFQDTDSDGDGLPDKLEEGLGTDSTKADTDGDGVSDGEEVLRLNRNPLSSGNLIYDNTLTNRLKGKILLQVESRGEAWYVHPDNGKRYYMKDGDAAYQIMRFLSLGITNADLSKIKESGSIPAATSTTTAPSVPLMPPSSTIDQIAKAIVEIKTYAADYNNGLVPYRFGSGTIINQSGIVLTSYHVVKDKDVITQNDYPLAVQICTTASISSEAECNYIGSLIAANEDLDVALLQIEPVEGLVQPGPFAYVALAPNENAQLNDSLSVMGYPSIGSDTLTLTQGILSGKVDKYGKQWLKTDATTSFGNSGGAVIDSSMKLVGMPNAAQADYVGSLGYALSVNSFASWVSSNIGNRKISFALQQRLAGFTKRQLDTLKVKSYIQTDPALSIQIPMGWQAKLQAEHTIYFTNPNDQNGGYYRIYWESAPVQYDKVHLLNYLREAHFELETLSLVTLDIADVKINNRDGFKVTTRALGNQEEFYVVPAAAYLIKITYGYGKDNKDKATIDSAIQSLLITDSSIRTTVTSVTNALPVFSLTVGSPWIAKLFTDTTEPVSFWHKQYPEVFMRAKVIRQEDELAAYDNAAFLKLLVDVLNRNAQSAASGDRENFILYTDDSVVISANTVPAIYWQVQGKYISSKKFLYYSADYIFRIGNYAIDFEINSFAEDKSVFEAALADARKMLASFSFK